MKKIHKGKQQLLFALLSVFVLLLVCLLQSCQPDGKMVKSGTLGLRLSADTTSLNKGVNSDLKTKGYEDEFEEFLETSDYSILIVKDQKDTVQTFPRYDEMPAEIELAEGAYTLIASKGDNKGAAFENPYFEGSTDFTIRGDMNTYIDVTCTLGNTRVVTESSKEFDDVYEDYTIVIKTPYTSEDGFEIEKGETSPAFFRADKEGTEAEVSVKVKKKGETEEKLFTSSNPLLLERRQNVNILLKLLEGNQGIGLEVTLDDKMIEFPVDIEIPDYMWGQHDKPKLNPLNFENGCTFTSNGVFDGKVEVSFKMPGGVGSLIIKRWLGEDEYNGAQYDLVKADDAEAAINKYLSWTVEGGELNKPLTKNDKNGKIDFTNAINTLESPVTENSLVYHYKVYGTDATGKHYPSDTVTFNVKVLKAESPMIIEVGQDGFPESDITEGDVLSKDKVVRYMAPAKLDAEASVLKINVGSDLKTFALMSEADRLALQTDWGILVNVKSDKEATVTFPKEFSANLKAPTQGVTSYSYTFSLKDQKGNAVEKNCELRVNAPVFSLDITDGNAFAKRVHLRGQLTQGKPEKLTFLQDGQEISPKVTMLEDGHTYEAIVTGLTPETSYTFQIVYNKSDNRKSEEKTVKTELENTFIPNAGFEEWEERTISGLLDGANLFVKKTLVGGTPIDGWATVNDKTFVTKANIWSTYNTVPSSLKCEGIEGNGVRLRTVGWDNGAGNSAISLYHVAAGKLFLGKYSYNHDKNQDVYDFGYEFTSRPSKVNFYYKYIPYNNDSFKSWVVVVNRDNGVETVLGKGEIIKGGNISSWTLISVPIIYTNLEKKATHYYIVFSSSSKCSEIETEETSNLKSYVSNVETDGYTHYEGSNLYIDNVQLIYE